MKEILPGEIVITDEQGQDTGRRLSGGWNLGPVISDPIGHLRMELSAAEEIRDFIDAKGLLVYSETEQQAELAKADDRIAFRKRFLELLIRGEERPLAPSSIHLHYQIGTKGDAPDSYKK